MLVCCGELPCLRNPRECGDRFLGRMVLFVDPRDYYAADGHYWDSAYVLIATGDLDPPLETTKRW